MGWITFWDELSELACASRTWRVSRLATTLDATGFMPTWVCEASGEPKRNKNVSSTRKVDRKHDLPATHRAKNARWMGHPASRKFAFLITGFPKSNRRSFAYHPQAEKRLGPRALRMTALLFALRFRPAVILAVTRRGESRCSGWKPLLGTSLAGGWAPIRSALPQRLLSPCGLLSTSLP